MKCEVQRVRNNPRFRILKIEGNTYILDMSQSIWNILFPFLTWIVPNTIYKVDGEEINNQLQHLGKNQSKHNISFFILAGIGIALGNLLTPLTDYLELESTLIFNSILSGIMIMLVFLLRSYLSNRNKKKFYSIFNKDKLSKERIWIRPMSFKHFMKCFLYYVLCLGVSILCFIVFILYGNLVPLIAATTFLLAVLVANGVTVLDDSANVKFVINK